MSRKEAVKARNRKQADSPKLRKAASDVACFAGRAAA
jgi:hypothetical protein